MSLYLTNKEKLELLKTQQFTITKKKLLHYLNNIQIKTIKYIDSICIYNKYTHNNIDRCVQSPIWQLGHISHFYIKHTLELLKQKNNLQYKLLEFYIKQIEKEAHIKFDEFYDSHKTLYKIRFTTYISLKRIKTVYYSIIKILYLYINKYNLDSIDNYLIMLSILHNDMHNENYNFTLYYFKNVISEKNLLSNIKITKETPLENSFINIPSGFLHQGSDINKNRIIFDNETPSFLVKINEFKVSKYPITEYQFLEFVLDNGYNNIKYWSKKGLLWKKTHNIKNPLYWLNINNEWYRKHINSIYKIGSNLPICNISWYEAEAYCNWKNVRFINEYEWEYISTNLGRNTYPWGDNEPTNDLCNINNKYKYCVDVNLYKKGENRNGVSQLIGNIWEWCEEVFYPYPNFTIDYIYREMSYPFFGEKKICRGGCFCVNDYLIHPKYRNAQDPGCQIQYIGFRVCLKSS